MHRNITKSEASLSVMMNSLKKEELTKILIIYIEDIECHGNFGSLVNL